MNKTALVVGATGLVGNFCLEMLVASQLYQKIIVLSRKRLTPQLFGVENIVTDFSNLSELQPKLSVDHVFCALGTTMAKAGTQQQFRKVDFEYPLKIAEIAKAAGAKKFLLVSAIGADSQSKIFYSRVKGELEEAIEKLNYESLLIFQPSILLGKREDFRWGEMIGKQVAKALSFMFVGALKPYKGINAIDVAKAMVVMANQNTRGIERLTYTAILNAAEKFGKW